MEAALLIVLVGELTAPLKPELVRALPTVFSEKAELVAEAPPGRDVVWVTAPARDSVVLTLHIANEPGDLRREMTFSRSDSTPARARAVAFAIASMRGERKKTPVVETPTPQNEPPSAVAAQVSHWFLSARGFAALMLPQAAGQGGGLIEVQYLFPLHLVAGLSTSLSGGGTDVATWVQPAMWATVGVRFDTGTWVPRVTAGVGAVATLSKVSTAIESVTTWQPYFRAAVDVTWRFAKPHGLIFGISGNFTPASLSFTAINGNGNGNGKAKGNTVLLGPVWVAVELGYAFDF